MESDLGKIKGYMEKTILNNSNIDLNGKIAKLTTLLSDGCVTRNRNLYHITWNKKTNKDISNYIRGKKTELENESEKKNQVVVKPAHNVVVNRQLSHEINVLSKLVEKCLASLDAEKLRDILSTNTCSFRGIDGEEIKFTLNDQHKDLLQSGINEVENARVSLENYINRNIENATSGRTVIDRLKKLNNNKVFHYNRINTAGSKIEVKIPTDLMSKIDAEIRVIDKKNTLRSSIDNNIKIINQKMEDLKKFDHDIDLNYSKTYDKKIRLSSVKRMAEMSDDLHNRITYVIKEMNSFTSDHPGNSSEMNEKKEELERIDRERPGRRSRITNDDLKNMEVYKVIEDDKMRMHK